MNDGRTARSGLALWAAVAVMGAALAAPNAASAGERVQWSVTIGGGGPVLRAPVIVVPAPLPRVAVVPVYGPPRGGSPGYRPPAARDADGDGIPNRYDRLYNPRWDRDGDGVPNRWDRHPDGRSWQHPGYGSRDGSRGAPGYGHGGHPRDGRRDDPHEGRGGGGRGGPR